ncbi:MAG: hypothetical protein ACOYOV_03340 [Bacteroidales bacterium]
MKKKLPAIFVFINLLILIIFTTNCKKDEPIIDIYAIGNDYQGGKIAYVFQPGDSGYIPNAVHGIIAAPYDQGKFRWFPYHDFSYYNTYFRTSMEIGQGKKNTESIINIVGDSAKAAKICYDLVLNGYDDWVLPSYNELEKLFHTDFKVFGFKYDTYWSSYEEYGSDMPSGCNFYLFGAYFIGPCNDSKNVRAIRYF